MECMYKYGTLKLKIDVTRDLTSFGFGSFSVMSKVKCVSHSGPIAILLTLN